jgi:hypothetical protein
MEFINVRKDDDIVKIKITIEYVGPSKYSYAISTAKSFDYPANVNKKPYPHEYPIGKGKELILPENKNNSCIFQLMNPTNQDLDYKVFIEWYQGNDTDPIYKWPKKNSQEGKVTKPVFILSSDFIYK